MYDEPTRFLICGFDSESLFSGSESDDVGVDVVAVDGGRLEADVDGCQQLARELLIFFLGGIVCVWEEWGLCESFYCSILILNRLLRVKTCT